MGLPHHL